MDPLISGFSRGAHDKKRHVERRQLKVEWGIFRGRGAGPIIVAGKTRARYLRSLDGGQGGKHRNALRAHRVGRGGERHWIDIALNSQLRQGDGAETLAAFRASSPGIKLRIKERNKK